MLRDYLPAIVFLILGGLVGGLFSVLNILVGKRRPNRSKMEPYEWAYWMEGKPAEQDIKGPDGSLLEKAGATRDGGSYDDRMGNVACWNAVMDENDYMVRKWNEFIAA